MIHRGRGPSLQSIEGNIHSNKLPGGNLILAVLDRELMAWSDRGGASRYFGERWSAECARVLDAWVGAECPGPSSRPFVLQAVVNLDDNPRIAIQSGSHKLVNPDFVLIGQRANGQAVLQAADAKFAVDTIKAPQVSAEALHALLDVEGGLAREAIESALDAPLPDQPLVERGIFLSPRGPFNDYFLPRVLSRRAAELDRDQIVLLDADPVQMFAGLPMTGVIGPLASIDRLPVTPRENLLAAMYYFRLACACTWMWVEERTPLLSLAPAPDVESDALLAEVKARSEGATSGIDLVEQWAEDIEQITGARKSLQQVISVPLSMGRLREMVTAATGAEDRRLVRRVRAALDKQYRLRLVEEIGEVPAQPEEPLPEILRLIATASRKMAREFERSAAQEISRLSQPSERAET